MPQHAPHHASSLPSPAADAVSNAAWLHAPFDCAELRCGPLEALGVTV